MTLDDIKTLAEAQDSYEWKDGHLEVRVSSSKTNALSRIIQQFADSPFFSGALEVCDSWISFSLMDELMEFFELDSTLRKNSKHDQDGDKDKSSSHRISWPASKMYRR